MMKVVVASLNPVKIGAVRAAFAAQFPGADFMIEPVSIDSGVAEQPMSDAETRLGAHNRVERARTAYPDADYWVGLEGGLDAIDGVLMGVAWMAVGGPDGRVSQARTPTLPIPPAVQRLVEQGLELGAANDRVFDTVNSKQGGGAFGLLTDGRYTREGVYTQAVELALIPFVHALWQTTE
jgi:inosine/xanthosine triphosphatase